MKVAIIHDWLVTYAGAERVLEQILNVYPEADLYSLVDFIPKENRNFIKDKKVNTSFIQKFPFAKTKYRHFLPFMPLAIEQFDLSQYDLVISSSHAVAKGVITGPDQLHVCMCYSPIRYAWDLQPQYLKESNLQSGLKGFIAKGILHYIRNWDSRTANGVDEFVAISNFIEKRIRKVYRRDSVVIYPPVDVSAFSLHTEKEEFYLTASRMVPYKKIDLIVKAFSQMPDKKLIVIGDGPDYKKISSVAGSNVKLLGYQSYEVLKDHMQKAKAFVFAPEEDFGIAPIEAQACGTPVIAYGKGGALETIRGLDTDKPTGMFFNSQTTGSIVEAVNEFEKNRNLFDSLECHTNAKRFSNERFQDEFSMHVNECINDFFEYKSEETRKDVKTI